MGTATFLNANGKNYFSKYDEYIDGYYLAGAWDDGLSEAESSIFRKGHYKREIATSDMIHGLFEGKDLSRRQLSFANIIASKFNYAKFCSAKLTGARVSNSDFHGASFAGADLSYSDLRSVDFSMADFSGANLQGAKFHNSNFRHAILKGANFADCRLRGAEFCGAIFDDRTTFPFSVGRARELGMIECNGALESLSGYGPDKSRELGHLGA